MNNSRFIIGAVVVLAGGLMLTHLVTNAYVFYAGFVALQYVVISTGWNILGGYAGYVNFGSGAFVGLGMYAAVFLFKAIDAPLVVQILGAAVAGGVLGLGMGYLTLQNPGRILLHCDARPHHRSQHHYRQLVVCGWRARNCGSGAASDLVPEHRCLRVFRHARACGAEHRRGALD